MQQDNPAARLETSGADKQIRHLRQILLWPVYLLPLQEGAAVQHHWEHLAKPDPGNPWRELDDEFGDPAEFQERHYNEFVTFLPPVQRFLYGQGLGRAVRRSYGESPIRVMRRCDIAKVRLALSRGDEPIELRIIHVDLYFFFDIDIAILALEVAADNLELGVAQEALFRFGRAYPAYWEEDRRGGHCPWLVEWLCPKGEVLARSDYEKREKYLAFVCQHRAPAVASHWEYLLSPMVLDHSDKRGLVRYRQLEYYRMPYMAFFAMEDVNALTRPDLIRMAIGNEAGASSELPYSESYLAEFEERFCYDRYCDARLGTRAAGTRFMSTGHTLVGIGEAKDRFFMNADGGFLGRFRHQHFLLFLVAHFQKAALHMFSDRLVAAVSRLDVADAEANRVFRRNIRHALENFLRFEHRYWFHEISNQAQARELYHMTRKHLDLDLLYSEIREELQDMGSFLDVEAMRRQNETVVRLTVVTTFGLIGTVCTGFLGMNLLAWAEHPTELRILAFVIVLVVTTGLTLYTVVKSRRLSELLDALSDEHVGWRAKMKALQNVWFGRADE
jgi:hypothetical protein